jgi:hypothetical protein
MFAGQFIELHTLVGLGRDGTSGSSHSSIHQLTENLGEDVSLTLWLY